MTFLYHWHEDLPYDKSPSTKQILQKILEELESIRSGEIATKARKITIGGSTFDIEERSKDFAQGFTEGKNFAIEVITGYL